MGEAKGTAKREAADAAWADALAETLPRMAALLRFVPDDPGVFPTQDVAAVDQGEIDSARDHDAVSYYCNTLTVQADMRNLTARQVVRLLRRMAASVEADGIVIHSGPYPLGPAGSAWRVYEMVDGTRRYEWWRDHYNGAEMEKAKSEADAEAGWLATLAKIIEQARGDAERVRQSAREAQMSADEWRMYRDRSIERFVAAAEAAGMSSAQMEDIEAAAGQGWGMSD